MNRPILLSALLLAACGSATDVVQSGDGPAGAATSRGLIEPSSNNDQSPEALEERAQELVPTEGPLDAAAPSTPPPPVDVPTISGLLRARHVADLPDGDTLRGYETGEASLQWLSNYGDTMATRTRALMLLEHFSTAGTRAFALDYLGVDQPHLQAAAISALAGQNLDDDQEVLDAVVASLHASDVRVALATVTTLSGFEAGRAALNEAATDETLEESIREAAALGATIE